MGKIKGERQKIAETFKGLTPKKIKFIADNTADKHVALIAACLYASLLEGTRIQF